jgi:hypothetical protein
MKMSNIFIKKGKRGEEKHMMLRYRGNIRKS